MSRRLLAALVVITLLIFLGITFVDRTPSPGVRDQAVVEVELEGDTIPFAGIPADVATFLNEGRYWRAARSLRSDLGRDAAPELQLVAARAEAGWGGWGRSLEILDGADWLDDVREGEGWYWLGRARDEDGDSAGAIEAYDRYLQIQQTPNVYTRVAHLRRGLALLREGNRPEGIAALEESGSEAGEASRWIELLAAEAAAEAGDTAATGVLVRSRPTYGAIEYRARIADVDAHLAVGDSAGAQALAAEYGGSGLAARRANFALRAGRLALATGDRQAASDFFFDALDAPTSGAAGLAAGELLEMGGLNRDQRLEIAEVDARRGSASRAVQGFRVWLADAPAGNARDRVALQLGEALYNSGNFADAQSTLDPLVDSDAAVARDALLLIGRSQYRRNQRTQAFATFERLGERFPGSSEGAEGLFLVADLSHDENEMTVARRTYRDLADRFQGHDRAGLSLMRLGGDAFLNGDFAAAIGAWEDYRSTYPTGERWPQSTYWAARGYEEQGDTARANSYYRSIREREPLSYYALLSAAELNQDYWPIPMTDSPTSTDAQIALVEGWMEGVDLLREAGLHDEADDEATRLVEDAPGAEGVLYALAEALNERGYAIRGIRIGQRLENSSSTLNPRLLRILYPLPYRDLIEAEAREQGLDPFLVAALTRQESLFTRRISSPVGARGLMQLMPETGAAIARGVQIDNWNEDLLFNPEINVHLGTLYLEEQMDEYDRSLPSVFSAYNAGPHRINAWKSFPEFGDELLFTERIPYRETRDYVKILTRNIALYTGLYSDSGASNP